MAKRQGSKKGFSFETAIVRLERIVSALESGGPGLEESLKNFEEGVALVKELRRYLEESKRRVEILIGEDKNRRPLFDLYEEDLEEDRDEAEAGEPDPEALAGDGEDDDELDDEDDDEHGEEG